MAIKVRLKTELAKSRNWAGTRRRTVKLANGKEKTFVFGRKPIEVDEAYPEILNDPMLVVEEVTDSHETGAEAAEATLKAAKSVKGKRKPGKGRQAKTAKTAKPAGSETAANPWPAAGADSSSTADQGG